MNALLKHTPDTPPLDPSSALAVPETPESFLARVAELLHRHGTPAHRQERLLLQMAGALGLEAQFLVTPTSLLIAFGSGPAQRAHHIRVEPGNVDLGKLVEFDELLEDVEEGSLALDEARQRLEEIAARGPRYNRFVTAGSSGLASATAAVIFGGTALDVAVTFGLGVMVDLIARRLARLTDGARMLELVAASLSGFAAALLAGYTPLSAEIVTLASLIVLIPGLTLTVAMIELATNHLVSGTARLFGALTTFLTIAFGVALGRAAAQAVALHAPLQFGLELDPGTLSSSWELAAILTAPFAFAVLFQARPHEFGWIFAASVGGVIGSRLGSATLSPDLGPCIGALVVGLIANLFARLRNRPASVPLTPGILLLVPGSIGFRALDLFLARDVLSAVDHAFRVAIVATSLVGGLLISNALLPPRRSL